MIVLAAMALVGSVILAILAPDQQALITMLGTAGVGAILFLQQRTKTAVETVRQTAQTAADQAKAAERRADEVFEQTQAINRRD